MSLAIPNVLRIQGTLTLRQKKEPNPRRVCTERQYVHYVLAPAVDSSVETGFEVARYSRTDFSDLVANR